MEFKTEGYWISVETGGNGYVFVVLVLWVLICSHQDSLLLLALRTVLVAAARFFKVCATAITPRRRRRSKRRG